MPERLFLSGNEAIALGAIDAQVNRGCGYPGTPSSEILDEFSRNGGIAEWAPNEKCAMEVAIGVALAGGRSLCTMKHVGLNVAADPFFTIAYSGTTGGLVVVSADDPGMASSQNEQDNRRYAVSAGTPMLEPADSQECYDFIRIAFELADKWRSPILFRVTTRVCHSKGVVIRKEPMAASANAGVYVRDPRSNVMVPAFAKLAHRRLRSDLHEMCKFNENSNLNKEISGSTELGIITSGISFQHVCDAAPQASILKLGFTHPLPEKIIVDFAKKVKRCIVVEEGDPFLYENIRALGVEVEKAPEEFRFGELNVNRVKKLLAGDVTPEPPTPAGKPPQLCVGCPHRKTFETLRDLNCIVSGDIGCYTLGVMPPFSAIDTCVCMGASITAGLGMRHMLPESEARKVVSVIGDSTFMHSGLTGLVEMVYNRPKTGHVVIVLDNRITAMTGLQENPTTGRLLDHTPTKQISIEAVANGIGVDNVDVVDTTAEPEKFAEILKKRLSSNDCSVIIARRPCILELARLKKMEARG